jgi:hypothetical protein
VRGSLSLQGFFAFALVAGDVKSLAIPKLEVGYETTCNDGGFGSRP